MHHLYQVFLVIYRVNALPTNISRFHVPFWRAKGFLSVGLDSVNFTMNHWKSSFKYDKHIICLKNDKEYVLLAADILNVNDY